MKLLPFIKLIKMKINKVNRVVDNPICPEFPNNPFFNSLNKTYVWIEDNEEKTN
ncbi:MAG: hypothetical protein PHV37_01985 [Candidatus Gastranaerophilales bacterium]|nr:hypothetical protein [Candidatus Gastranaerophilales bacterium]